MISSVPSTFTLALPAGVLQNEQRKSFGNIKTCRALHMGLLLTAKLSHCSARQHSGQSDSKEPLSVLEAWFRSLLAVTLDVERGVKAALADKAVATYAWPCARDTGHNHLGTMLCVLQITAALSAFQTWFSQLPVVLGHCADPQQNQLQSANLVARASRVCTQFWWCRCRK